MCLPHAKQAQKLEQQILTTEKHPYMKQHPTLLKKKKKKKSFLFLRFRFFAPNWSSREEPEMRAHLCSAA